jgi:predicted DNA-binding transcriptional regulator YafY
LTDSTFGLRSIPEEQASGGNAFPDSYTMKILFDRSMRYRLIETYGLRCYEETDEGLLFSLNYTNKEYIFSWLLGFGDQAEILAPEEVREEFAAIARNISARYV